MSSSSNNIVAGSILAADYGNLETSIKQAVDCGLSWIHIDIMDGHFVPPIAFGASFVELVKKCTPNVVCDVHLMVEHPENQIDSVVNAGADYVSFHPDTTKRAQYCVSRIRELGAKPGIALSPAISLTSISELASQLDLILVMTVEPGFGGQKLLETTIPKITQARQLIEQQSISARIQVDGGVDSSNIGKLAKAGADTFVVGSSLFGQKELKSAYTSLVDALI